MSVRRIVTLHEVVEVFALERIGLQRESVCWSEDRRSRTSWSTAFRLPASCRRKAHWPSRPAIEAGAFVHTRQQLRDCSSGNACSVPPRECVTLLHQTGRAVFKLSDEYCCERYWWEDDIGIPEHNLFPSLRKCEQNAIRLKRRPTDRKLPALRFSVEDGS